MRYAAASRGVIGLFVSKQLYTILIDAHFGYAVFSIPGVPLAINALQANGLRGGGRRIPGTRAVWDAR